MSDIADTAATLTGYDPEAMDVGKVAAFLDTLLQGRPAPTPETLPLRDSFGRVLARNVICPVDVPPHDNSAMDGYAFDGAALDAKSEEVRLRVVGTVLAGAAPPDAGGAGAGEALRITTGAVMPAGLDTVVPKEFCRLDGDIVRFSPTAVRRGANRRRAGEDLAAGRPALRQGDRLGSAALGLVASLGLPTLQVHRRLRVAYFSTGDEILGLGEAPRTGAIYDSNRFTVFGMLDRLGCEVVDIGHVRDDPVALEDALRDAAARADAIVTSGGVSAGEADHTRHAMQRVGDMAFWRVAMRPGRPMAVGLVRRSETGGGTSVLFGLPGNPVAVMVAFLALVRPALLGMMGCNEASRAPAPLMRARSVLAIAKRPGRTEYQRGFVRAARPGSVDGMPEVSVAPDQGSGILRSMVEANALVVLPHGQGDVAAGDLVDVMMLDGLL
jgi:molybdopterin molybdotransferase